jgi:hypothetical protein
MIGSRSPLDRTNGLLAAGIVVCLTALVAFVGLHARPAIAELERDLEGAEDRLADFDQRSGDILALGPDEEATWETAWRETLSSFEPMADEPELIARVAALLDRPGVRELEVARVENPDAEDEALVLHSPAGGEEVEIRTTSLSIQFGSDFETMRGVVEHLDEGALPFRVTALQVRRSTGGVVARVHGVYFHRELAR